MDGGCGCSQPPSTLQHWENPYSPKDKEIQVFSSPRQEVGTDVWPWQGACQSPGINWSRRDGMNGSYSTKGIYLEVKIEARRPEDKAVTSVLVELESSWLVTGEAQKQPQPIWGQASSPRSGVSMLNLPLLTKG